MRRRTYILIILLLSLIRIYFALSPSYLHPDENFQGPEIIAGAVFSYPVHKTWEFTASNPIRSSFPLWLAYGSPMFLLRWLWEGLGYDEVPPSVVYWSLRVLMLTLSIVLEDWAVLELVQSPRARRVVVPLVASSYVTWTYQTHTFSNSLETLLVLWSLVLIRRITEDKNRSGVFASSILGFLFVVGIFNRITFPAFILLPSLTLLPHFRRKPFSLVFLAASSLLTATFAVITDTAFYSPSPLTFSHLLSSPTITPINNFLYNSSSSNLAQHGLHPWYQHLLINLSLLLGPAYILLPPLLSRLRSTAPSLPSLSHPLTSALSGTVFLSIFPHQEARFLLPAIPLLLSSIRLPKKPANTRIWIYSWLAFNAVMGVLMGTYHQGGVVPVQNWIFREGEVGLGEVVWWKTYGAPVWLLGARGREIRVRDLMGVPGKSMVEEVLGMVPECHGPQAGSRSKIKKGDEGLEGKEKVVYLVAPRSAYFLKPFVIPRGADNEGKEVNGDLALEEIWSYTQHLNLDDLNIGENGLWKELGRVVGDRGLVVWRAGRKC